MFLTCGPRWVGMLMPVSSLHLSRDCVGFLSCYVALATRLLILSAIPPPPPPRLFPPLVLATRVPALYMFRGSWLNCAVVSTAEGGGGVIHFRG